MESDCAEVDETKVFGGQENTVDFAVDLSFGKWLESGFEGDMWKIVSMRAQSRRTGVERRYEDTGIVGNRAEARIAFSACVERAAAEGEVVDSVSLAEESRRAAAERTHSLV